MIRFLCLPLVLLAGCGPMQMPMVQRLEPAIQQDFDQAWNKAASQAQKLDRQQWLDFIVGVQLFQIGVDRFSLHSEKTLAEGHVEMDITFDRAQPEKDRFVVQFFDQQGKLTRELHYDRKEVEKTYHDLFVNPPKEKKPDEAEDLTRRRKDYEERWTAITEMFPNNQVKK